MSNFNRKRIVKVMEGYCVKFLCFGLLYFGLLASMHSVVNPTALRYEYLVNPIEIDILASQFSFKIESEIRGRGQKQTTYPILVASSLAKLYKNVGDFWDSGKQAGAPSINTAY